MTLLGSIHWISAPVLESRQSWKVVLFERKAKRMAFKITLDRVTIVRPIEARRMVFLPFWTLVGSPEEKM